MTDPRVLSRYLRFNEAMRVDRQIPLTWQLASIEALDLQIPKGTKASTLSETLARHEVMLEYAQKTGIRSFEKDWVRMFHSLRTQQPMAGSPSTSSWLASLT